MNEVWVVIYEREELGHVRDFEMKEVKGVCDSVDYIKNKFQGFGDIVFENENKIVIRKWSIPVTEVITGLKMAVHKTLTMEGE